MGDESLFGLKSLAVLLVVLGALFLVNGMADVGGYPIPGAWSVCTGLLMLVAAYSVWRQKADGWKMALGAFALQIAGWLILRYVLIAHIIAVAGVSEPQAGVIRTALSDRLSTSLVIGLLVVVWVFPERDRFTN